MVNPFLAMAPLICALRRWVTIWVWFLAAQTRRKRHIPSSFSLSPLRKALKDYTQIVESYYTAILSGQASRVEAIDMTRRSIHNEAAEILTERLDGKLAMDHDTARRFVTIINSLRYDGKGGNR